MPSGTRVFGWVVVRFSISQFASACAEAGGEESWSMPKWFFANRPPPPLRWGYAPTPITTRGPAGLLCQGRTPSG